MFSAGRTAGDVKELRSRCDFFARCSAERNASVMMIPAGK